MRGSSIFMCSVWSYLDVGEILTDEKLEDISVIDGDSLCPSSKDRLVINPVMIMLQLGGGDNRRMSTTVSSFVIA